MLEDFYFLETMEEAEIDHVLYKLVARNFLESNTYSKKQLY